MGTSVGSGQVLSELVHCDGPPPRSNKALRLWKDHEGTVAEGVLTREISEFVTLRCLHNGSWQYVVVDRSSKKGHFLQSSQGFPLTAARSPAPGGRFLMTQPKIGDASEVYFRAAAGQDANMSHLRFIENVLCERFQSTGARKRDRWELRPTRFNDYCCFHLWSKQSQLPVCWDASGNTNFVQRQPKFYSDIVTFALEDYVVFDDRAANRNVLPRIDDHVAVEDHVPPVLIASKERVMHSAIDDVGPVSHRTRLAISRVNSATQPLLMQQNCGFWDRAFLCVLPLLRVLSPMANQVVLPSETGDRRHCPYMRTASCDSVVSVDSKLWRARNSASFFSAVSLDSKKRWRNTAPLTSILKAEMCGEQQGVVLPPFDLIQVSVADADSGDSLDVARVKRGSRRLETVKFHALQDLKNVTRLVKVSYSLLTFTSRKPMGDFVAREEPHEFTFDEQEVPRTTPAGTWRCHLSYIADNVDGPLYTESSKFVIH